MAYGKNFRLVSIRCRIRSFRVYVRNADVLEPAAPRVRCWHGCVRSQGVPGMVMVVELFAYDPRPQGSSTAKAADLTRPYPSCTMMRPAGHHEKAPAVGAAGALVTHVPPDPVA